MGAKILASITTTGLKSFESKEEKSLDFSFIDTFDYESKMNCFWMEMRRRNALAVHSVRFALFADRQRKVNAARRHLTLEALMEAGDV